MSPSIIVAVSENGAIGSDGKIPWHLPRDLKEFKKRTTGHAIIMGRKTYESIGKPLPGRHSIVLSRTVNHLAEGVDVVRSLDEAFEKAKSDPSPFIIGGAEIYNMALPHVHRVFLTRVCDTMDGDTFFPVLSELQWELTSDTFFPADPKNPIAHRFEEYRRISPISPISS
jgi:dihydrofolate reductase